MLGQAHVMKHLIQAGCHPQKTRGGLTPLENDGIYLKKPQTIGAFGEAIVLNCRFFLKGG